MREQPAAKKVTGARASDPAVGGSFEDKLLRALISAHLPRGTKHRHSDIRKRLVAARKAVFDQDTRHRPEFDDDNVLYWMGKQHYIDLIKQNNTSLTNVSCASSADVYIKRSITTLAKQAKDKSLTEDTRAVERIRKKFSANREYWLAMAQYHDDIPESIERDALQRIASILSRFGIRMDV